MKFKGDTFKNSKDTGKKSHNISQTSVLFPDLAELYLCSFSTNNFQTWQLYWFIRCSFQTCWWIFANWSQSNVEKTWKSCLSVRRDCGLKHRTTAVIKIMENYIPNTGNKCLDGGTYSIPATFKEKNTSQQSQQLVISATKEK